MPKKYKKKTRRSRRKSAQAVDASQAVLQEDGSVQLTLPLPELLAGLRDAIEELAVNSGLLVMDAMMRGEVEDLTGAMRSRSDTRTAVRWGTEDGYVALCGRKVPILRPRVRSKTGGEISLSTYEQFQGDADLERDVSRRIVRQVTTRNYEGVIDDVCDGYGIEKSSVSRHWKAASSDQLRELMESRLDDLDLVALVLDGIEFQGYLLVVALGVTRSGHKRILGLSEGATENAEVCKALLENLVERGLRTDRKYLFVLDGSKALRKAVDAFFGENRELQRCTVHKERNVLSYLPKGHHGAVRLRYRAALNMTSYSEAKAALKGLVQYLRSLNDSAARSLEEAFEELLTLHRLQVPPRLRISLRSTNIIENAFSRTSELCRNVKRWRSGEMAMRWAGTMLLEAQKTMRRIKGYRLLPTLITALNGGVDEQSDVA